MYIALQLHFVGISLPLFFLCYIRNLEIVLSDIIVVIFCPHGIFNGIFLGICIEFEILVSNLTHAQIILHENVLPEVSKVKKCFCLLLLHDMSSLRRESIFITC